MRERVNLIRRHVDMQHCHFQCASPMAPQRVIEVGAGSVFLHSVVEVSWHVDEVHVYDSSDTWTADLAIGLLQAMEDKEQKKVNLFWEKMRNSIFFSSEFQENGMLDLILSTTLCVHYTDGYLSKRRKLSEVLQRCGFT
jgi:hypothetical protein